ncbi:MAG: GIY-YIG nuclease family protein [Streptococcaceae bacterium]|jgi:hypothetical protein|nr:GIY-YIG nuclease family protein [Streptococcaceae bacterium]
MATAKIIELLLEDGNLDGLLTVQDSTWNGTMFVSSRESTHQLFQKKETNYWGIYLLLSESEVYIGQASELQTRVKQHDKTKDFWVKCILFTTKDNSLSSSALDYIESELIEKAKTVGKLHIENKQKGNRTNASLSEKVKSNLYIENALFLLELIGITVFKQEKRKDTRREQSTAGVFLQAQTQAQLQVQPQAQLKAQPQSQLQVQPQSQLQAQPQFQGTPAPTASETIQERKFFIELSDGFHYQGRNHKDTYLRTIEHLSKTYPENYKEVKSTLKMKRGRLHITQHQILSKTGSKLYKQIYNGDFVFSNQSAESLKSNLQVYLEKFGIKRVR